MSVLGAMVAGYCLTKGYPVPAAEHPFCDRKWALDFAWPDLFVAVEVHGAVWKRGRHTRGGGFEEDRRKMNEAQLLGWTVIEVSTGMVESGELWAYLDRVFGGDDDAGG